MLLGRLCYTRALPRSGNRWISISAAKNAAAFSAQAPSKESDLWRTRNIGIIAHIDAGKTTTTERMLYYSGHTRRIGDVDDGSTVTDFLPAERARGITIQSAAISFNWPPSQDDSSDPADALEPQPGVLKSSISHNINLIDTPGHADFTFEVLRSLRILDGAICILDGVAGVEAQTEKVWTQAEHYQIPRIIYVNKLDRDGAAFANTVKEIATRLQTWPAVCQIPWWNRDGVGLRGVGDVVHLRGLLWQTGSDGRAIQATPWVGLEGVDRKLQEELKKARIALVELLSNHDDEMVEKFLEYDEDHLAIPPNDIIESLRRCVLQTPQEVVPVFGGASFRNVGVQPLLDAVVDLLPSPHERPPAEISIGGQSGNLQSLLSGELSVANRTTSQSEKTKKSPSAKAQTNNTPAATLRSCALAFKVVNDAKRGVLVYVRVYSGSLDRNALLYNTNLNITEKAPRLLKMYANDAVEVPSINAGQIGVIVGLKHARTGDTLISYSGLNNSKSSPPAPINSLQLRPIAVPPPVFFTSVEPNSLSEEKLVKDTLNILLREDPSLNVTLDPESGQTHLAGMGELHLEIARDRLINDFKAKARTGKIEIGYREALLAPSSTITETVNREFAGKSSQASCCALIQPLGESSAALEKTAGESQTIFEWDCNRLVIRHPTLTTSGDPVDADCSALPPHLPFPTIISSLQTGVIAALARCPIHGFPVHSAEVVIDFDPSKHVFPDTTPAALSTAVRQVVQAALKETAAAAGTVVMEPVMLVTITVNESDMGSVMHDLCSARGGQVTSLDGDDASNECDSAVSIAEDKPVIDPKLVYTPPDPFGSDCGSDFSVTADRQRQITARVPLKEMVGYLKHLRSLTGGRGTFVMQVDRFEKMSSQRQKVVLNEMKGDYV